MEKSKLNELLNAVRRVLNADDLSLKNLEGETLEAIIDLRKIMKEKP